MSSCIQPTGPGSPVPDDLPLVGRGDPRQAGPLAVDAADAGRTGDVQDLVDERDPSGRALDVVVELPDLVSPGAHQGLGLHPSHRGSIPRPGTLWTTRPRHASATRRLRLAGRDPERASRDLDPVDGGECLVAHRGPDVLAQCRGETPGPPSPDEAGVER